MAKWNELGLFEKRERWGKDLMLEEIWNKTLSSFKNGHENGSLKLHVKISIIGYLVILRS